MATNFNNFTTATKGFIPVLNGTPLDVRTVVETFSDISSIPNPFLGMHCDLYTTI